MPSLDSVHCSPRNSSCAVLVKRGWHISHCQFLCYLGPFRQFLSHVEAAEVTQKDGEKQQPKWALLFVHDHRVSWLSDPCGPLILWLSRTECGFFCSQLWNSQGVGPPLLKNNHHWSVRGSWHKKRNKIHIFQVWVSSRQRLNLSRPRLVLAKNRQETTMQTQVLGQIHLHLPESFVLRRQKVCWQFSTKGNSGIAVCTICSFRPKNMLFVLWKKQIVS